jgi:FkbM family methyltransferase
MFVIIPEIVSLNIYRYGFFEEGLSRLILEYLKPGMTFLDIGAHFGYFTLLSSLIVGNSGFIHAFEPTARTFDILKSNTSHLRNVTINNKAVYSKQTYININDYGIRYSAFNTLHTARLSQDKIRYLNPKSYVIDAISVDKYVKEYNIKPDFVKIDAESSEYEILLGMKNTIEKFRPIISLEVGDMNIKYIPSSKEVINFMIRKKYNPYEYNEGKIKLHKIKYQPYQYDNILFLPKE